MVTTPTVWKAQYRVDLATAPVPLFADIGFGKYVTVWNSDTDVLGAIRDAEGNPAGVAFVVNQTRDDGEESPASVASRPGGGFLALYDSLEAGEHNFYVDAFDLSGTHIIGESQPIISGDPSIFAPAMTVAADGSYLVTYSRTAIADSTVDIVAKFVDADGILGSEVTIFDSGDTAVTSSAVAALTNGTFVFVYQDFFAVDDYDVKYEIIGLPASGFVSNSDDNEFDMKVASLSGGGFVVVWTDSDENNDNVGGNSGIMASVHGSDGTPVSASAFHVNTTAGGNQTKPAVVGLKDGGFVVVWLDDQFTIRGQRFDADGTKVGDEFNAGSDGLVIDNPSIALLGDGRFIVGVDNTDEDFLATIFDPRGTVINGTNGQDTITSRIEGATVNGLAGPDVLLGQAGADTLNGGADGDLMAGRNGSDIYVVDSTSDSIFELGSTGTDLVRASLSFSLANASAVQGKVENLTLTGSAAIDGTGNPFANVITGNAKSNTLSGANGNDTLKGASGSDFLTGGLGKDTLIGGTGLDKFDFNAIAESVVGINRDTISGFSHAQHDRIDLATIDADQRAANPGNDVFTFIGTQSFAAYHAAHLTVFGMVRVAPGGVVQLNVNASLAVDAEIKVAGLAAFVQGDFSL